MRETNLKREKETKRLNRQNAWVASQEALVLGLELDHDTSKAVLVAGREMVQRPCLCAVAGCQGLPEALKTVGVRASVGRLVDPSPKDHAQRCWVCLSGCRTASAGCEERSEIGRAHV